MVSQAFTIVQRYCLRREELQGDLRGGGLLSHGLLCDRLRRQGQQCDRLRRHSRGTTLAELLVVMATFSLLITVILGFYVHASRLTKNISRRTDVYRRATSIADKIEVTLSNSRVFFVSAYAVTFSPLNTSNTVTSQGPVWTYPPKVLVVDQEKQAVLVSSSGVSSYSELIRIPNNVRVSLSGSAAKTDGTVSSEQQSPNIVEVDIVVADRDLTKLTAEGDYKVVLRLHRVINIANCERY